MNQELTVGTLVTVTLKIKVDVLVRVALELAESGGPCYGDSRA